MNVLIKKYRYVIYLIIVIIIVAYICYSNYNLIENYSAMCRSSTSFPSINYTLFKDKTTTSMPPVTYYNIESSSSSTTAASGTPIISYYTQVSDGTNPINDFIIEISSNSLDSSTSSKDKINDCATVANSEDTADFFAIDTDSNCKIYRLSTDIQNISADNGLIIKNFNIADVSNSIENLFNFNTRTDYSNIGYGGFTTKAYNYIKNTGFSDFIRFYNPSCDIQNAEEELVNKNIQCINNLKNGGTGEVDGVSCETLLSDYDTLANNLDTLLGGINFYQTDNYYSCSGEQCISGSFQGDNYLAKVYNNILQNTISDSSYADFSANLYDFKLSTAQENESGLATTSTYIKYLFLIVIIIVTVVMIFMNITNPDVVTAEILISYIIFLVLLIFVTSNYFNVDYGPLNKFFSLQLGNAGDRNVFQNLGYSAS